ncbi:MAG: UDP-glucose--hexose-1-phosphate uridylyltransferase [Clostridiales bacterium]|jgi:UDPglucose--hexose-1-phosphate uridylyltransferase|nr:UDP-glucose--hexose-1-phosphate uridylyltransferase [Clostridiales bacterium]
MISQNQIAAKVEELLAYANFNLYLKTEDNIYVRNLLLDALGVKEPAAQTESFGKLQSDILDPILEYAAENGLCENTYASKVLYETRLMGIVSPLPSFITETFDDIALKRGVKKATEFLADYSVKSNYIRMSDINKNVQWETAGRFGKIIITINRSKPEKDPKDIEKAKNTPKGAYPKCALCRENVGFAGDVNGAARQTLRTIPILLNGQGWQLQFSPYVYYKNHCIALSDEHRPMRVDKTAFEKMFDFTDLFPHFFIGSNAALPIVGGSILAHDHFQGGDKVLPMFDAGDRRSFVCGDFKNVSLSIVDWYNSVVRLKGKNRAEVTALADKILTAWQNYDDKSVGIISHTGDVLHNAVTPIARFECDGAYILDLILRNNRTDEKHPFGIFHPPVEFHNIKKEGIGIIEVMGLFILPGRLYEECREIVAYISGEKTLDVEQLFREEHPLFKHAHVILKFANEHQMHMSVEDAQRAVNDYIDDVCQKILECTAVFKNTDEGQEAFGRFIKHIL